MTANQQKNEHNATEIASIYVYSTNQQIHEVARMIVDKLEEGSFQFINLNQFSPDGSAIRVIGMIDCNNYESGKACPPRKVP